MVELKDGTILLMYPTSPAPHRERFKRDDRVAQKQGRGRTWVIH